MNSGLPLQALGPSRGHGHVATALTHRQQLQVGALYLLTPGGTSAFQVHGGFRTPPVEPLWGPGFTVCLGVVCFHRADRRASKPPPRETHPEAPAQAAPPTRKAPSHSAFASRQHAASARTSPPPHRLTSPLPHVAPPSSLHTPPFSATLPDPRLTRVCKPHRSRACLPTCPPTPAPARGSGAPEALRQCALTE